MESKKTNDIIINLPIDKNKVDPQLLNLVKSLFNTNNTNSNNTNSNNTNSNNKNKITKSSLLVELKPFIIIAILFALFNICYVDTFIINKLKPSNDFIKVCIKTLAFIIILYIVLNFSK